MAQQLDPFAVTPVTDPTSINWSNVLYVVFDLETTGRSRRSSEIIEIAAVILDQNGIPIEDANFVSYVRPKNPIPSYITAINNITNNMVCDAHRFSDVGAAFLSFMQQHADEQADRIDHIILVGHNARVFDIPFLVHHFYNYNLHQQFFEDPRFEFGLDTMRIAKKAVAAGDKSIGIPTAYNLGALHQFVMGRNLENAHQALEDVKATIAIFRHEPFWAARNVDVYKVVVAAPAAPPPEGEDEPAIGVDHVQDSSDEGSVKSVSSVSTEEEDDDEEQAEEILGDRWEDSEAYSPDPIPTDRFQEHFSWTGRHRTKQMIGLNCNPVDVNTPIRAWRQIFTKAILDRIVGHTNEYGETHCKSWTNITKQDLEDFIAILFVSGIQKRKDKPTNWFTQNSILENPIMKRIMSGKKFHRILRYLHCCPVANQNPMSPGYDPAYKIAELRDSLERRYLTMFVPGQQLSLDETLVRAYGRIKFKVRIITKSARYGIKLYVITDAATSYVLRVIVYTGKSTYTPGIQGEVMEEKKTVQIVTRLVEPFVGTHRTIYVDRFYTSIDLLKALRDRDLYVTGTVMANRLPKGIKVDKKSAVYRAMKRGDFLKSKFMFMTADGGEAAAGLVSWRDGNMVYCLSNDCNNFESDECRRRVDGGILTVPRPISIARYNKSMGGVDLADQKRMQCSSMIMGIDPWWLKLFFTCSMSVRETPWFCIMNN